MVDHLVTTQTLVDVCRRCRRPTLVGLAEGLRAVVDLVALDPAGERAAILAGRWTYTLAGRELVHRDAGRIAGTLRGPVLATHECDLAGKSRQW